MTILTNQALLEAFNCKRLSDLKKALEKHNIPHLPCFNGGIVSTEKALD